MNNKRGAFTLVELIVVVTILALLSTIGFVSYSSYLSGVRDTNRLSQLVAISDGLELYRTKKTLPIPDDNIEIRANGTVIGYQGYAGVNVLETIDYSKTGKDPKDKTYFSYYLTQDKKYYQLLTYLEEEENLEVKSSLFQKTHADTDYTNRYPKVSGKKIGILTQSGTNIPVQEVTELVSSGYIDIATTTDSYVARLTDDRNYSGTGTDLVGSLPNASCNRIKQMGLSNGDGEYTINPTGNNEFKVYCDMSIDGGGWTLAIRLNTNDSNIRKRDDPAWSTSIEIGDLSNKNDFFSQSMIDLPYKKVNLKYTYSISKYISSTYENINNILSLKENLNLSLTNNNQAWDRTNIDGGEDFFGESIHFQSPGDGGDRSRIWYNLVPIGTCNQGGSIGHIGDYGAGAWYWEVGRGTDNPPDTCQHNGNRLGLGLNYDKKLRGINDVLPLDYYDNGIMYIFIK